MIGVVSLFQRLDDAKRKAQRDGATLQLATHRAKVSVVVHPAPSVASPPGFVRATNC